MASRLRNIVLRDYLTQFQGAAFDFILKKSFGLQNQILKFAPSLEAARPN
jgi:hypothetical protein